MGELEAIEEGRKSRRERELKRETHISLLLSSDLPPDPSVIVLLGRDGPPLVGRIDLAFVSLGIGSLSKARTKVSQTSETKH